MPRWKALPEELDPQISEFTSQLRRLVDRSGLGLATIADRTGYSKSSWEKYLNGRLLPPRGAVQALSEVTGTDIRHLATMWELAERAWSRSEMRHDMTMEAMLVAQARAALAPSGETPAKGFKWNRGGKSAKGGRAESAKGDNTGSAKGGVTDPPKPTPQLPDPPRTDKPAAETEDRTVAIHWRADRATVDSKTTRLSRKSVFGEADARRGRNTSGQRAEEAVVDSAPAAASAPAAPAEPATRAEPAAAPESPQPGAQPSGLPVSTLPPGATAGTVDPNFWGSRGSLARSGGTDPAHGNARPAGGDAAPSGSAAGSPAPPSPSGRTERSGGGGRGRGLMVLVGAVAALVVVAGGVFAWDSSNSDSASAQPSSSPGEELPSGVKCSGDDCYDKDPEAMGCGGQHAKTAGTGWVGPSMVEVRYSEVCGAAWARISGAAEGDSLRLKGGKRASTQKVGPSNYAYTSMVPVEEVSQARACATLDAGNKGCVRAGDSTAAPKQ